MIKSQYHIISKAINNFDIIFGIISLITFSLYIASPTNVNKDYVFFSSLSFVGFTIVMYSFMLSKKFKKIENLKNLIKKEKKKLIDDAFNLYNKNREISESSKFYSDLSIKLFYVEGVEKSIKLPKATLLILVYSVVTILILSFLPTSFYILGYFSYFSSLYFTIKTILILYFIFEKKV